MTQFSVLLSVYAEEKPDALMDCFESLINQTLSPSEIILVCDGPLSRELEDTISLYMCRLPLVLVRLDKNIGLGAALSVGLKACQHELIARMDTDDICVANRFEKQVSFLEVNASIHLLGGAIAEFKHAPSDAGTTRRLPTEYDDILRYARSRNPLNHMTVMFRKSSVLDAGNYKTLLGFEDYYLWARMIVAGYQIANLDDVLVYVRIGNGMLARRGGLTYMLNEVRLYWRFYQIGFVGFTRMCINIIIRAFVRILPNWARGLIYRHALRQINT